MAQVPLVRSPVAGIPAKSDLADPAVAASKAAPAAGPGQVAGLPAGSEALAGAVDVQARLSWAQEQSAFMPGGSPVLPGTDPYVTSGGSGVSDAGAADGDTGSLTDSTIQALMEYIAKDLEDGAMSPGTLEAMQLLSALMEGKKQPAAGSQPDAVGGPASPGGESRDIPGNTDHSKKPVQDGEKQSKPAGNASPSGADRAQEAPLVSPDMQAADDAVDTADQQVSVAEKRLDVARERQQNGGDVSDSDIALMQADLDQAKAEQKLANNERSLLQEQKALDAEKLARQAPAGSPAETKIIDGLIKTLLESIGSDLKQGKLDPEKVKLLTLLQGMKDDPSFTGSSKPPAASDGGKPDGPTSNRPGSNPPASPPSPGAAPESAAPPTIETFRGDFSGDGGLARLGSEVDAWIGR